MVKKVNYFCDGKDCNKELLWSEMYYIIEVNQHIPNVSYSGIETRKKYYCQKCFKY